MVLSLAFCFLLVFPHKEGSVGLKRESVRSNTKTSKIIDDQHNKNLSLNISIKPKQTRAFLFFSFLLSGLLNF